MCYLFFAALWLVVDLTLSHDLFLHFKMLAMTVQNMHGWMNLQSGPGGVKQLRAPTDLPLGLCVNPILEHNVDFAGEKSSSWQIVFRVSQSWLTKEVL